MNYEQQLKHFEEYTSKMKDVLFKKGNDYANEDRLSNFKLAGEICGSTAELNCLNLIATKVARLGVLLKSNKIPNNESIRDSILDLSNYSVLLDMIEAEKEIITTRVGKMPSYTSMMESIDAQHRMFFNIK